MNPLLDKIGRNLARYLSKPHREPSANATPIEQLRSSLLPGDVLLVEGNSRISTAIKYLTQSTWSHAALYVGPQSQLDGWPQDHCLVEADTVEGVRSIDLESFAGMHARICRPIGLSGKDCRQVIDYTVARIGHQYDLRNIIDLVRYLLPTPPVPSRFRRRMIALGSGDPSRAICSTLIAQAFQTIRYPILPMVEQLSCGIEGPECVREIYHIRHYSLFTPRDFDVSPYFRVIKPGLSETFDFHQLRWDSEPDPG